MKAAAVLLLCAALVACGKETAPASYRQVEYAKNPDGDCVKQAGGYYASKAATKAGIEEVIYTVCQYRVRGDFHFRQAQSSPGAVGDPNSNTGKAMRCLSETKDAAEALQRVGVTQYACPGDAAKAPQ